MNQESNAVSMISPSKANRKRRAFYSMYSAMLFLTACSGFSPAAVDNSHALVVPVDAHHRSDSLSFFPGTLRENETLRLELKLDTTVHADSIVLIGYTSSDSILLHQDIQEKAAQHIDWTPALLVHTRLMLEYYVADSAAPSLLVQARLVASAIGLARAAQLVEPGTTWSQSISAQGGDSLQISVTCSPSVQASIVDSAQQPAQILWTSTQGSHAQRLVTQASSLFYVVKNSGSRGSITDTLRVERTLP